MKHGIVKSIDCRNCQVNRLNVRNWTRSVEHQAHCAAKLRVASALGCSLWIQTSQRFLSALFDPWPSYHWKSTRRWKLFASVFLRVCYWSETKHINQFRKTEFGTCDMHSNSKAELVRTRLKFWLLSLSFTSSPSPRSVTFALALSLFSMVWLKAF